MPSSARIKPNHKAIQNYYRDLKDYKALHVEHEGALETAFSHLLADTGRSHGWSLTPKFEMKAGGKRIVPDGAFRDEFNLLRGYWEAKDAHDDLDDEIRKKRGKGYPLANTIFEDTRQAVLFQNGNEVQRYDLTDAQKLADLLNDFYAYTEPDIEGFEAAVTEFKERVPDLAKGLADKINAAHKDNKEFQKAFDGFFTLCQQTLNPNIRVDAVDEMLVQHLLTERLFRTIFDDEEFTRRNVIAAEIEMVIKALVSKSFSRTDFLKSLDKFYKAIEGAAALLEDFSDKQHFLNTVYERFFQGYSVKVADTHGIVYTPQAIVDFMCASVVEVLEKEFKLTLGSPGVNILDPCTGTGNFIVNLLRRIPKRDLPRVYTEQLFANEVMLLPYYIAALNIEHAYYELTGKYEPFEGLCFVDTLDLAEEKPHLFTAFNEKNSERVERQKKAPITVIIGNPPYNMGQQNENDNNKNRKYKTIDKRIGETYAKGSKATLITKLYDAYVKCFRWAFDRLGGRDGIVCFVSNNSFVDQIAFDSMRGHLEQECHGIYHLDLHGNVRENPKLSGTTHNVFGIQVGVGITICVRHSSTKKRSIFYHRVKENWRKEEKLNWLTSSEMASHVVWDKLVPDADHTWLRPRSCFRTPLRCLFFRPFQGCETTSKHSDEFAAFFSIGSKATRATRTGSPEALFKNYSPGVNTARDGVVWSFQEADLKSSIERFCESYNSELDRFKRRSGDEDVDAFLDYTKLKWSRNLKRSLKNGKHMRFRPSLIRKANYRPFAQQYLYFSDPAIDELGKLPIFFPGVEAESENRAICVPGIGNPKPFFCALSDRVADFHFTGDTQCFPFYVYDEDGGNRRENITDWALQQFRERYGRASDRKADVQSAHGGKPKPRRAYAATLAKGDASLAKNEITKWDIFYYVYGILHHPGYRAKFADNLKRELPRIPFAADFWAFANAGKELARLHLDYEKLEPWALNFVWADEGEGLKNLRAKPQAAALSYRVEKMKLSKDKAALKVNESLTLNGIPPAVFEYRLGNRSDLEWVIDQYQVSEDKRSGISSDPNRDDDPEYIVRLVGQVVRVSVETVKIVNGLPAEYAA